MKAVFVLVFIPCKLFSVHSIQLPLPDEWGCDHSEIKFGICFLEWKADNQQVVEISGLEMSRSVCCKPKRLGNFFLRRACQLSPQERSSVFVVV